jgi:CheY-like chemotaxis protein
MPMDRDNRPHVLVVNYHADTNRVMQRLLERLSMRVTIATSAAEAVVELERGQVDVMVTRLGLPDRPGRELMREMKARFGTPAIAMSGLGSESDIRASRDAGFSDHLVMPINLPDLLDAIRRVVPSAACCEH